jgi:pyridoxal phosphate enzyme (YggS family)
MSIADIYQRLRAEIPAHVTIVPAVKTRSVQEMLEVIEAGATDLGHNYVQEAEQVHQALGSAAQKVRWHLIGHLQTNKINKALQAFDVFQTVDSLEKAQAIDVRAARLDRVVPVYIEVNSAAEASKSGIAPEFETLATLARGVCAFSHVRLEGLMTMGPLGADEGAVRRAFRKTRQLFDRLRELELSGACIETLSMGMTDSYQIAIEEGATMVRPGTIVFGSR